LRLLWDRGQRFPSGRSGTHREGGWVLTETISISVGSEAVGGNGRYSGAVREMFSAMGLREAESCREKTEFGTWEWILIRSCGGITLLKSVCG